MKVSNGMKTYTLSSMEVEALLVCQFGERLQPVDALQMARQRNHQQHLKQHAEFLANRLSARNPK